MKAKVLTYLAAFLGGSVVFDNCGFGGFVDGILKDGWVDNRYFDIVTDWLWEDLLLP